MQNEKLSQNASFILDAVRSQGFLNLSQFIEISLYNSEFGYYTTRENPFGFGGDFVTAPQMTSIFGSLIGLFFVTQFQLSSKNNTDPDKAKQPLRIVEFGPGNGFCMRDMLNEIKKLPQIYDNVKAEMVEISPKLQDEQRQVCKDHKCISWHDHISELPDFEADYVVFFGNEFLDAFGVRQFTFRSGIWHEILVVENEGKLSLAMGQVIDTTFIDTYLSISQLSAEEGMMLEISPECIQYFDMICKKLLDCKSGMMLMVDYGFVNHPKKSTIQSMQNGKQTNFLDNIGQQDITHLIDFTFYHNLAKTLGLKTYEITTQSHFLNTLGIDAYKDFALKNAPNETSANLIKEAVKRITEPDKMGDLFKVLFVEKQN